MATPRQVRIAACPAHARVATDHVVAIAIVPVDTPETAVIEWTTLSPSMARHVAQQLIELADEGDAELGVDPSRD